MEEIILTGGGRSEVSRKGDILIRNSAPWSKSVQALLKFLEDKGFSGSPRVIGSGFDEKGRETLSYIEGEFIHPNPFSDEAIITIGRILRELHNLTENLEIDNAIWRPWFGRNLSYSNKQVIGHCDFTPWNLVCKDSIPFAAIDWENAVTVDPLVELAQVCWLNVQLCDDDIAERVGLGSVEQRAKQLKLLIDAYELCKKDREILLEIIIKVAILDAADQAIEANVTIDSKDIEPLWAIAWRTRSAAWIIKNHTILNNYII